jgi:hypothetical protein
MMTSTAGLKLRSAAAMWPLDAADLAKLRAKRGLVETLHRKRCEDGDAIPQIAERRNECLFLLDVRAIDRGRIFDAPVRRHWLPRPYRACLAGSVIANGEDEIHDRRV